MSTEEFIKTYTGKYVERYDSTNPHECVDLFLQYIDDVHNLSSIIPVGIAVAYDLWTKDTRLTPYVDKIKNTVEAIPQEGDIVIWESSYNGGAGHVGIATGRAGQLTLDVFQQNDPIGSVSSTKRYSYDKIAGWLRIKKSNNNMNDTMEIEKKKFEELITKLDNQDKVIKRLEVLLQSLEV